MKKYRVVHVGTGAAGIETLRSILRHPELELVGQYVNSDAKIGRDSGEIAGMAPIGVKAVKDWNALLALKPDCLSYVADGVGREQDAVRDMVRFLEQGSNVVTTAMYSLTYPPSAPAALREPLASACARGNSSFYNTGCDPGFATAALVNCLLAGAGAVSAVRMSELGNYADYAAPHIMREVWGFGKALDWPRPVFGGIFTAWWTSTVQQVADTLGAKLDDIRAVNHAVSHVADIPTTFGTIPKGTTAAVRMQLQGMVKGKPFIIMEHVNVLDWDVAPQWPRPVGVPGKSPEHQYQIAIDGIPSFTCELDIPDMATGLQFTGNHAINAIPAVCKVKAGLLLPTDLPHYTTRTLMV